MPSGKLRKRVEAVMVIVEILWHIKKGKEEDFLRDWRSKFVVTDRSKLIGEFLSRPNDLLEDRFKTWRVEQFDNPAEQPIPFVNVALWESFEAFLAEINKHIPPPGATKPDYEVARYRMVLEPVAWRLGPWPLGADSPGTS
jgi:hypothetical protein